MKTIVQANLMLHARIVGDMKDCEAALRTMLDFGWHVVRSGPRPSGHHHYDLTRFEIVADRVVFEESGEDPGALLGMLERALP